MNAETKKITGSPFKRIVPTFLFSIACLVLLGVGVAAWEMTQAIGAAHDNAQFVPKPAFLVPSHSAH